MAVAAVGGAELPEGVAAGKGERLGVREVITSRSGCERGARAGDRIDGNDAVVEDGRTRCLPDESHCSTADGVEGDLGCCCFIGESGKRGSSGQRRWNTLVGATGCGRSNGLLAGGADCTRFSERSRVALLALLPMPHPAKSSPKLSKAARVFSSMADIGGSGSGFRSSGSGWFSSSVSKVIEECPVDSVDEERASRSTASKPFRTDGGKATVSYRPRFPAVQS